MSATKDPIRLIYHTLNESEKVDFKKAISLPCSITAMVKDATTLKDFEIDAILSTSKEESQIDFPFDEAGLNNYRELGLHLYYNTKWQDMYWDEGVLIISSKKSREPYSIEVTFK